MRQIRRGVFETNSSSTHSITIRHKGLGRNHIPRGDDGYIHVSLGEFGWEICDYTEQIDRLSYLVTMLAILNRIGIWCSHNTPEQVAEELMSTKDFQLLSEEIGDYAGCHGVIVDPSEGYIDHQSYEDYRTFEEFLDDLDTNVVEFVFGRGNVVHTDNDNH